LAGRCLSNGLRKNEAEAENDREPDPPHGHLGGGWLAASLAATLPRFPEDDQLVIAQGVHTASGDYVEVILLTALVVTLALPLYYYRNGIVEWFRGKQTDAIDGG
jgi:hypothetical protein